ncbi:MAG TPA: transcriptional repressor [Thermoguttaceae bacterium]
MNSGKIQRNTRQRKVILEELQKLKTHPTASGLYVIIRRRIPKISLGTVYRNLELLSRMGIIKKLEFGSEARYDGTVNEHDHLRCLCCGRVDDAPGPPLALSLGRKEDRGGYQVIGHRLELLGVCPKCQRGKQKRD